MEKNKKTKKGGNSVKFFESEEMYLETILLLTKKKSDLHAIDVCEELGYARSSVSRGMALLKEKGYITVDSSEVISLTEIGKQKAEGIYERHMVLTQIFMELGADEMLAEENACRIEHVISDELFDIIKAHIKKQQNN